MKKSLYISLVAVLLVIHPATCYSQPLIKPLPKHDFINYESNRIEHYGDTSALHRAYAKLDSILLWGNNHLSVLHIGGSHIQADIFPHQIRRNIAALNPSLSANRGVLFPYKAAKTNSPWNYKITHCGKWKYCKNSARPFSFDMGMTGYTTSSTDSDAQLCLQLNNDSVFNWSFNTLKIFATTTNAPIKPIAYIHDDTIASSFDSINNIYTFIFREYIDSVNITFRGISDSNAINLTALLPESSQMGITYHSTGVNGASVPSWLRCTKWEEEVKHLAPDIVILNIGINDANMSESRFNPERLYSNYNKLIARLKTAAPNAAIIFITNNDCYYSVGRNQRALNKNSVRVRETFIALAKEHNASIWDMFSIMGGLSSIKQWEKAGLARPDKIHFTIDGYKLIGDMFFNAIINDYLYE